MTEGNRRHHARYTTEIQVDCRSGDTFLFSYIQNISEMGIFIRSNEPLPVGTHLALRFHPDGEEAFEISGQVVWVNPIRPIGENINPGMGVRFEGLTPDTRERVVALVRTIAYLQEEAQN
jgi:type IV pilus assembly protein PilZ